LVIRNTANVSTLANPANARALLDADTTNVDGKRAAAKLLRWHTEEFGYSADGKLFTGVKGGELPDITIRRAWTAARAEALTAEEQASPLAKRIYDLRHACRYGSMPGYHGPR
jgi:hypothetical protein